MPIKPHQIVSPLVNHYSVLRSDWKWKAKELITFYENVFNERPDSIISKQTTNLNENKRQKEWEILNRYMGYETWEKKRSLAVLLPS